MKLKKLLFGCLIVISISSYGQNNERVKAEIEGVMQTSQSDPKLMKNLKKHPEYDTNKDGILTSKEYKKNKEQKREDAANAKLPDYCEFIQNVNYAGNDNLSQCLDVYIPHSRKAEKLPAIVYIHGGGFKGGSKDRGHQRLIPYMETGEYVAFSIDYRLSGEALWPAQIHDCKAAVRWVKANAEKYGVDPNKIGTFGGSAGGHLTTMLAATSVSGEFEGNVGEHLEQNGSVTCAVNGYGPSDLLSMDLRQGVTNHDAIDSPESRLLGGLLKDHIEEAKNASPVTWVTKDCTPLFIYHGTEDDKVILEQSEILVDKLTKEKASNFYFAKVIDAGHSIKHPLITERMLTFYRKYLWGDDVKIDDSDIIIYEE